MHESTAVVLHTKFAYFEFGVHNNEQAHVSLMLTLAYNCMRELFYANYYAKQ